MGDTSMPTAEEEKECMQAIETHLQGYYDKDDLEPGFTKKLKVELLEILDKYYDKGSLTVDVHQIGEKKVSVAINPKGKRHCPSCFDEKLSSYTLDTMPVTKMYYCGCGWEGQLD